MLRRCLLLLLLLTLAGCSTRFFYNRLDFLVPWHLRDYVSLEREQRALLDRELAGFLDWHRQQELPRYHQLLAQARERLDDGFTQEDAAFLTGEAQRALDRLQWRSLEWMLPLGQSLTDEQILEFIASLREQQSEYQEKYLERDEQQYRDDACERLDDNVRRFLGRLEQAQKERLHRACGELIRSDHLWLASRAAWIEELEGLLLQREPGWQQRLRDSLASRDERLPEGYREAWTHNLGVLQLAVVEVIARRSERQDQHLARELGRLQADLVALSDALPADLSGT